MIDDRLVRCFYEGKDAVPGDVNPYAEGSAEWSAWTNGFSSEWDERTPMTEDEVKAAFRKVCVICGESFTGYGNNAAPVSDGLCCDDCNRESVIPVRFGQVE